VQKAAKMRFLDEFISLTDVSKRTHMHIKSVLRLVRQGKIPGEKRHSEETGRKEWWIHWPSLETYIGEPTTFGFDRTGPKLYLTSTKQKEQDDIRPIVFGKGTQ
jgi:hypothetical protein